MAQGFEENRRARLLLADLPDPQMLLEFSQSQAIFHRQHRKDQVCQLLLVRAFRDLFRGLQSLQWPGDRCREAQIKAADWSATLHAGDFNDLDALTIALRGPFYRAP